MSIGIVGAGIAGLHLALRLHQLGIDATLYTDQSPEQVRAGRPRSFVIRHGPTRATERLLGVAHWESDEFLTRSLHLYIEGGGGFSFHGELADPSSSVDFRIYLATLMEDYQRRGGNLVRRKITDRAGLADLADGHELLVVTAGRGALAEVFPRDAARSPYRSAQRNLVGGQFHGVRPLDPPGLCTYVVPGVGEIHAPPQRSFTGAVTVLLVESVPAGPFDALVGWDHDADPGGFVKTLLDLLALHAPSLRERVDEVAFGPARPLDLLRGAVTPVVRSGWAEVAGGTFALAIGDAWIAHDPMTAQGANVASRNAAQLAELLRLGTPPYDEQFCREVSGQLWATAQPAVNWTNTALLPPRPHVLDLLAEAGRDSRVAQAYVDMFADPEAMWNSISEPAGAARFLARARSTDR